MTNAPVIVTAESHALLMNRGSIEDNAVCILIDSPGNKRELLRRFSDSNLNFLNCIIGFFDDVEDDSYGQPLTASQADALARFVKASVDRGRNRIIVSCPSGMWIGRAIACAIDAHFLGGDMAVSKWLATGEFLPNPHVLFSMLDAFGMDSGGRFWREAVSRNRRLFEGMNFPSLDVPVGRVHVW